MPGLICKFAPHGHHMPICADKFNQFFICSKMHKGAATTIRLHRSKQLNISYVKLFLLNEFSLPKNYRTKSFVLIIQDQNDVQLTNHIAIIVFPI